MPVDVQGQQQVGAGGVREAGPVLLARTLGAAVGSAGEERRCPGGREPALDPGRQVVDQLALVEDAGVGARSGTAVARVDDDELAGQRRAGPVDRLGVAHRVRAAADDGPAELGQRLEGGRAAGAVGHARRCCAGSRAAPARSRRRTGRPPGRSRTPCPAAAAAALPRRHRPSAGPARRTGSGRRGATGPPRARGRSAARPGRRPRSRAAAGRPARPGRSPRRTRHPPGPAARHPRPRRAARAWPAWPGSRPRPARCRPGHRCVPEVSGLGEAGGRCSDIVAASGSCGASAGSGVTSRGSLPADQMKASRSRSSIALGLAPTIVLTTSPPW